MKKNLTLTITALTAFSLSSQGATLVGGTTSVALDTDTLSSAANLQLSDVSEGIGAGLLPNSVAFPINPVNAAVRPTTFTYTSGDFPTGPFSGSIGHTGSVFFNNDSIELGSFTIAFDATRATGGNTGFFVTSNAGIVAPVFDTQLVSLDEASDQLLDLTVDLVVSPELAGVLLDGGLATTNLTGADVGDARIRGDAIPEASTLLGLGMAGLFVLARRRRS